MTRAAIYLRQSLDVQEGIDRQRMRTRGLADVREWEVVEEYVDNDTSASKPRGPETAWGRMLEAVRERRIDVVVAVDLDRLLRSTRDLNVLIDAGAAVVTVDGQIDLATADGEFRATMLAGIARFEVRRKGERQKRANQHRRGAGVPAGGRRAFGYTRLAAGAATTTATRLGADGREWPAYGHEPYEPEASAVRRGYDLLLAGATLRSIARSWNDEGLTTTVGHVWEAYGVRGVLANPRYAALVAPPRSAAGGQSAAQNLRLGDLPTGSWEPLVTPETWAAARDLLVDPARTSTTGPARKHLLSGVSRCGVCGAPMKAGAVRGIPVYRCGAKPHLARKRDDADRYVTEVVLDLLETRGDELLLDRSRPDLEELRRELGEAQAGERQLAGLIARGLMSTSAAEVAAIDVRKRIGDLEAKLTDAGRADVLVPLVRAADVRAAWDALDVDRRRGVVRAMFAVTMQSPGKGSRPPRDPAGRLAHTASTMVLAPRWATS
jgi:site-specific DNA recombinase